MAVSPKAVSSRAALKREELQRRILREARDVVVAEGFAALSMRKLAERADCALGTLYLYFKNRDDIARHLWTQGFGQLLAALEPSAAIADPAERMRALARAYVDFGLAERETYRLMLMEDPRFSEGTTYSGGFPRRHGRSGHADPRAAARPRGRPAERRPDRPVRDRRRARRGVLDGAPRDREPPTDLLALPADRPPAAGRRAGREPAARLGRRLRGSLTKCGRTSRTEPRRFGAGHGGALVELREERRLGALPAPAAGSLVRRKARAGQDAR